MPDAPSCAGSIVLFECRNIVTFSGANLAASVISWNATQGVFVLDVPGVIITSGQALPEQTNGFAWLAIGF